MVAFVTGASGFIGSHLTERLRAQNHAVRCLVQPGLPTPHLDQLDVERVEGNLGDDDLVDRLAEKLDGVRWVYHLAGLTKAHNYDDLWRVNAGGTEQVARACAIQSTPPVLVLVSSIAAAGPITYGHVRKRTDALQPISDYGRSKHACEETAQRFAEQTPISVIRPGMVFGPRDRVSLPIFSTIKQARVHFVVGRRTPPLSLIHVEDLVEVFLRVAERGSRLTGTSVGRSSGQGCYFACYDEYPDYAELGRLIRPMLRRRYAPVIRLPGPLVHSAVGINQYLKRHSGEVPSLNADKLREALASSWACSPTATHRELEFSPTHTLRERLQQTVDWYCQEGWL